MFEVYTPADLPTRHSTVKLHSFLSFILITLVQHDQSVLAEKELSEKDKTTKERENAGKLDNHSSEPDKKGVGLEERGDVDDLGHVEERSHVDREEPPTLVEPSKHSTHTEMLPDKPLQLVRPDPTKHRKLELIGQNVKHLYHINTAVAVVAVVGKFHSGKSFLLNQLMGKLGLGLALVPLSDRRPWAYGCGERFVLYVKCYMTFINIPTVQFMCFNGQLHDFYSKEACASMKPVSATLTLLLTIGIAVFLVAEICVGTRSLQI